MIAMSIEEELFSGVVLAVAFYVLFLAVRIYRGRKQNKKAWDYNPWE